MSSVDGCSCARTRGWQGEYRDLKRYTNQAPSSFSSDKEMSFMFDSEQSGEEEGIEKAKTEVGQSLSGLKDTPQMSLCADQKPVDLKPSDEHKKLNTVNTVEPPEGEMPLVHGKEATGKHRDKHKKKDKDRDKEKNKDKDRNREHSKSTKRKDKHSDRDKKEHKRKNVNEEEKRNHDKHSERDKKDNKRNNDDEEEKKTLDILSDRDKKDDKRRNEDEEEKNTHDKHSERDKKDNKRKCEEEEEKAHHRNSNRVKKDNKMKNDEEEEKKTHDKYCDRDKKDNKRKNDDEEKMVCERNRKSEKPHDWVRDDDMDNRRREKRRTDISEKEYHWACRYDRNDKGHSEYDSHRQNRYRDLTKLNHHKSSIKSDRDKEEKKSRPDSDQRTSNKGRSSSKSPRPRSRWGRSPSPHHNDREEKDWSSRDKSEKDGSNRYRRSGLGGYSPRRRKSDAAVKTPSPPRSSPERKKPRAWDLPPAGMDTGVAVAMAAAHQAAAQQAAALASVSSLVMANPALAAVSLTQATRNLRRLYIGNVPATVSDCELLEFVNAAMLSVNANHIPGTKPCINCMVNVEKSYAFAEFLTAEDATAGLAFDGITLHGTTLKIKRPRDYVPPPSGGLEYTSVIDMVSNVVPDSPNKIFVGGICKSLSADKVKEIVTAFGQLKAYHWELRTYEDHVEAFVFLEYLDPSLTLKACAGLNGLKLGNRVITVVQATPDANSENGEKKRSSYGIPEHAKTLLQTPTRILEFQNVITEEEALTMTEAEFLEIEEDVRLECARFGTIKSTHVVKPEVKSDERNGDQVTADSLVLGAGNCILTEQEKKFAEYIASVQNEYFQATDDACNFLSNAPDISTTIVGDPLVQSENIPDTDKTVEDGDVLVSILSENNTQTDKPVGFMGTNSESKHTRMKENGIVEDDTKNEKQVCASQHTLESSDYVRANNNAESLGTSDDDNAGTDIDIEKDNPKQEISPYLGRVYVEFTREECACKAAHVLHGRLFGERKVIVSYFPLKVYQKKFGKGLGPRTHEEKQALALAAQEHLNTYLPDRD